MRLMKCSHSTKNDMLTLDAGNGVHNVEWSVDLAFGVHPDFKSHVGGTHLREEKVQPSMFWQDKN